MTVSVRVGDGRLLGVRQRGVVPEPISVNGVPGTYQKGPDDQSLTVDRRPARWITVVQGGRPSTYLVVEVRPERVLTVEVNDGFSEGPLIGRDDSIRIAGSVVVDETWPDWTITP